MLQKIKTLLGLTDDSKDSLLLTLIEQAEEEIINYTRDENSLEYLQTALLQMVVFKYNRLGTEGVNTESYSGVSFNYTSDYPEAIMRQLKKYRKAVFK